MITHRVEDQSLEGTVEQLEALNPKLQDLLARPAFWDLRRVVWEVLCKVLPKAEEREQWKLSVTQFLQVMAHRKILRVTVGGEPFAGSCRRIVDVHRTVLFSVETRRKTA